MNTVTHRCLITLLLLLITPLIQAETIKSVSEDYPPYEYVEDGEIKGFTVDLLNLLYERTGHTGTTHILPWARAYKIAQNEANVLVHRMTRSEKREQLFKWIGKVSDKKVSLYKLKSRTDLQLNSLKDAKRYQIGTIIDQSSTKFLYNQGFEESVNTFSVPTLEININKLFNQRIDLVLAMEPILQYRTRAMGYSFRDLEEAIVVDDTSEFHMAFSQQTSDELVAQFRTAFAQSVADGSFQQLWHKHFGE